MASHYLVSLASNRGRFWIQEFMQLFIQLSTAQASTEGFPPVSSFWLHLRHAIPWSWSTGAVMNQMQEAWVGMSKEACPKTQQSSTRRKMPWLLLVSAARVSLYHLLMRTFGAHLFNSARFGFLPLNCCILPAISDIYKAFKQAGTMGNRCGTWM